MYNVYIILSCIMDKNDLSLLSNSTRPLPQCCPTSDKFPLLNYFFFFVKIETINFHIRKVNRTH